MEGQTVKIRTCYSKKTLWPLFMDGVQLLQGQNHLDEAVRYILGISILVFQNLLAKTEYAKHVVRNITFSEAAGQDSNITGQTASEQVLFYLNVHLFDTIVSIHGIWEVGDSMVQYGIWEVGDSKQGIVGDTPSSTSISASRNGMRWKLLPGISFVQ